MKFLSFILAIMVLVLSCIPCSDGECSTVAHEQSVCVTYVHPTDKTNNNPLHEHHNLCSPFCQCSCCAVAYALPSAHTMDFSMAAVVSDKLFASYAQQQPTGIALPIWQPPQLV